jgi:SnoaL-like domain
MGAEENKVIVRRFVENVASGRDVSVADDVLAPGYVNLAFDGVDIAGLKAMTAALSALVGEARTSSLEMVAEGDAVFARFDYAITLRDGSHRTSRGLAYYRLTDARIDVNDVMMTPDLHELLGPFIGPPPTDQ